MTDELVEIKKFLLDDNHFKSRNQLKVSKLTSSGICAIKLRLKPEGLVKLLEPFRQEAVKGQRLLYVGMVALCRYD